MRTSGAVAFVSLLALASAAAAGVVKVKFSDNGFFVTGSSKTTGNGSTVTVCNYFDGATGAFVAEIQDQTVAFDDESSLQAFCASQEPTGTGVP
jgi:hypothetical protein